MSKFKLGDYVTIADYYVDITQGRAYQVNDTHTNNAGTERIGITDDAGDAHDVDEYDCTIAICATATPVAQGNPFKGGDIVEALKGSCGDITKGKAYTVTGTTIKNIHFIDDNGDANGWDASNFKLALSASKIAKANPHGVRKATVAMAVPEDEEDYDTRKAASSVCSKGRWQQGQVLVYADGTPTMTTLTVKFCTASCVTFDETYSQPFNPDEFEREY